ncbi:NAD(P)/FAD-dependent oxidoreductase [Patulibacter defluvii]|uniref:NAD(P)/FAD-dependent oxidoreductase n=1 Tax=Patulibacter defluvii TaxID=3095358 RepID=UPI002A74A64A|nr:FAD-binding oxidoreductase [Patulibacter sp. DM4]
MSSAQRRIAIVGGGAAGMSTAVHAARLGAHVTVIERQHPGAGSTGLSAGVFTTTYGDPLDVALRVEAAAELERLAARGLPVIVNGFLRLAHADDEAERFARAVDEQARQGVRGAALLDPADVGARFPELRSDDVVAALWAPGDAYTDGHVLCSVWADELRERGGRIVRGSLDGFQPGAPHRLRSGGVELLADVVVNAAGAWAPAVGARLGHRVPMVIERHQLCFAHLDRDLGYRMPTVMDYAQGSGRLGVYFRHEGERRLLAGLHSNDIGFDVIDDPDDFRRSCDEPFMEEMAAQLLDRLPGLELGLEEGYAGLYPYSPDGRPIVGPVPGDPTVIVATGGGGVGVNLAPPIGRLAAEWAVLGAAAGEHAAALLPDRFVPQETA